MNIHKAIDSAYEFYRKGNLHHARDICIEILNLQPNDVDTLHFLGVIYFSLGNSDLAIESIKKALDINPNFAEAYNNLGNIYYQRKQNDEALTYYKKALHLNPNLSRTYYNLGIILQEKKQLDEAIFCYQKALQLNLHVFGLYNNLGLVLQEKGKLDEAIFCYQKALQHNPRFADAYYNLGLALKEKNHSDEVVIAYCRRALDINPYHAEACSQLIYQLQNTCEWQELKGVSNKLDALTKKALDTGTKPAEFPFLSIIRHTNPASNLIIAKAWSTDIVKTMSSFNISLSFDNRRTDKQKIVIGYLSNDFRNHPMAHLTCSLFGLHNRNEFEVFSYSYGEDDGSYYRERIKHDCDRFIDITALNYDAAAKSIYEDHVDILIDLKGYFSRNRIGIFALRPAPIQVRYLGFPSSTGADFFDYIITDKIVTPKESKPYYSENFVLMPHCYQINDHNQPISKREWGKIDFKLPENHFIFCSFNQPYKIDPVIFDIWMRILKQVPESVLWLGFNNKNAEANLRREAEARGVESERLIFAARLVKSEHLARLKLADLALDTRIVNGHITTSDALWSGVPVITLQGCHFASRAASSILSAMGLHELIAHSAEEYEALAVGLARDPLALKEIRQKIAEKRLTSPLFDTPRFVKNLETAYKAMWKIFLTEESPREIEVLE